MKLSIFLTLMATMCACVHGSAPVSGGFLSQNGSSVSAYWYHPSIYACIQENIIQGSELTFVIGDQPVEYAIACRMSFPQLACLDSFSLKLHPGDNYPSLPGDQYSPFRYAVYYTGHDSLPRAPAEFSEINRLCGGTPCACEWVMNDVDILNPGGMDMWLSCEWADSTPTAPQLKCFISSINNTQSAIGIKTGEVYDWTATTYCPIMKCRFLTPLPIDTVRDGYRISPVRETPHPDSFLVTAFYSDGSFAIQATMTDTLIRELSSVDLDSVLIRSCYGLSVDDSGLTITYDIADRMPLTAEICGSDRYDPGPSLDMFLTNNHSEPLTLTLGYDQRFLSCQSATITLGVNETRAIPFTTSLDPNDSAAIMITVLDLENNYYPHIVTAVYPFGGQTDTDLSFDDGKPNTQAFFSLYPNPCTEYVKITSSENTWCGRCDVFDILGRKINAWTVNGPKETVWDTKNARGTLVAAGMYFIRMTSNRGEVQVKKAVIIR